jgi:ankyrin repeat protein
LAAKAIFAGDVAALKALVLSGLDIHEAGPFGNTLLINAASSEDAAPLQVLLEMGADPNQRSSYKSPVDKRFEEGFTPILYARTVQAASMLIDRGADVNAASAAGTTALMRARTVPLAKLLLEAGANINAVNGAGTSALMFAANRGDAEVVEFLLTQGADPALRQHYRRGKKTYSALRLAEEGLATWSKFTPEELGVGGPAILERFRQTVHTLRAAGAV